MLLFTSSAAASLVVSGGLAASPASAAENTLVTNVSSGHCITAGGGGDVYWLECNGGRYQMWDFRSDKMVVNVATVRALTEYGGSHGIGDPKTSPYLDGGPQRGGISGN